MRRAHPTVLLALTVSIALLISAGTASAREDLAVGGTATVFGTEGRGLRVRSGPGFSHRGLTVLSEGAVVIILDGPVSDGQDDWYQVNTGRGITGWSLERFLRANEASQASGGSSGNRSFVARTTAYANGVGGVPLNARTALGTAPRPGVVAVDPKVIPLHSVLTIEGFEGVFVAEDTGGGVRGATVDVWLADPTAARSFGTQFRSVTVVREGPASPSTGGLIVPSRLSVGP